MSRMVGPYAIQGLLGSGGIGEVYAALDQDLGRRVALKALRPEFSEDSDLIERFRNEAASLARLHHPNITMLYSLYRDSNSGRQSVFMVMEMVCGETLEAVLARAGRFSTRGCLAVMAQAVAGLSYAHSVGIIHRDIKPSNMMLNDAGLLKITDFGIARMQGSQRLTRHGAMVGTLNYVAPEQIKGQESDERSDLYSLACVLYELLSGRKPFVGLTEYELIRAQLEVEPEPLLASVPDLEPSIDRAVMRALAKNPDDRFSSVAEFAEVLGTASVRDAAVAIVKEFVLADVPLMGAIARDDRFLPDPSEALPDPTRAVAGPPPEPAAAPTPGMRRRGWIAMAAAVAVVVMASGGGYLTYELRSGSGAGAAPEVPAEPAATQARRVQRSGERAIAHAGPAAQSASPAASAQAGRSKSPVMAQAAPPSKPVGNPVVARAVPSRPPANPAAAQAVPSGPAGNRAVAALSPLAGSDSAALPSLTPPQAVAPPAHTAAPPAGTTGPLAEADKQAAAPQPPGPDAPPAADAAAAKAVAGQVSAYTADGWPIVAGVTVRLNGVGPLAPGEAKPLSQWIATHGNYLACAPAPPQGYRCLTRQNLDLAQAILLNGAARTSTGAAAVYREAEAQARSAKRGIWQ